jgi:cystathionine beta-lyase/cystathionine gamma-synthase
LEEAKFVLAFSSWMAAETTLDFGGVLSFEIDSDIRGVRRFLGSLRIFALAESLGGAESLIKHPATMTHAYLSKDERGKSVLKIH